MRYDPLNPSAIARIATEEPTPKTGRKIVKRIPPAHPILAQATDKLLAGLIPGTRFKTTAEARAAITEQFRLHPDYDLRTAWLSLKPMALAVTFASEIPVPISPPTPRSQPSTNHWRSRYAQNPSQS